MSNRWKAGFIQYFFDPLTQGPAEDFGAIYAWGDNLYGQMGQNDGSTVDRSSPVQIGSLSNWQDLGGGSRNSFYAINATGELFAWGENGSGRLGLNDIVNRSSPVQVGALTTWSKVEGGNRHCLAIKTDGTLWIWGEASDGQLGLGDRVDVSSPTQLGSDTDWSVITGGQFMSLAIKTDGTMWSWGQSYRGEGGHTDRVARSSPVQVGALTTWLDIACNGSYQSLATTTDNKLYAWGRNNYGQVGDNTRVDRSSPTQIGALTNWSLVGGGSLFNGAIKTDGTIWSWGFNAGGQLGDNSRTYRSSPVQIGSGTTWFRLTKGRIETGFSAIKTDGTIWSWGQNSQGTLGVNDTVNRSSPVQVGLETNWLRVAATEDSILAAEGEQS